MKKILWICVVVALGTYIAGPIVDPDLWWHITVGRWILANNKVPTFEHWNLFAVGEPWVAYSWMPETILALIDRSFGVVGLAYAKLSLGVLTSLSFIIVFSKMSKNWFFGALIGGLCTFAIYNHFTLRPQTFIWIYFSWTILVTDLIRRDGIRLKHLIMLAFCFFLWANTHLSSAIGLLFVAAWLIGEKGLRVASIAVITGFVATLITPYFGREWLTLFSKAGHPFAHRAIAEFQSATIMQYPTGFLVIMFILLLAFAIETSHRAEFSKLAICSFLSLIGLAVVKFLPFAYLSIAALLALYWRDFSLKSKSSGLFEGISRLQRLVQSLPYSGLSFVFICWSIVSCAGILQQPLDKRVPVEALDFIVNNKLKFPLLHGFGEGGYVMYRLSDQEGRLEQKVVIDGRTNVTPNDVWSKFLEAHKGKENWHQYLDLVEPQTVLWHSDTPFSSLLLAGGEFKRVFQSKYEDGGYSVFVRKVNLTN